MGVFSLNSHIGPTVELEANTNYEGLVGNMNILIENEQNSQKMFEAVLGNDIRQAVELREGALDESAIEAINEGSISGFIAKVKEVWKKVCEKIKGVYTAFMARLNGVVMKDNKAFLNKYKDVVLKKDLSKMKFKWSAPTSANFDKVGSVDEISGMITSEITKCLSSSNDDLNKIMDKINDGDMFEEYAKKFVGEAVEPKEFPKAFHEKMFEDEEEVDGLSADILNHILEVLSTNKSISAIKKKQTSVDKLFNVVNKSLSKAESAALKHIPGKGDNSADMHTIGDKNSGAEGQINVNSQNAMKQITTISACIGVVQKVASMATNEFIKGTKFDITQCRRVFAKAAGFNPKSVKESMIYAEAFADAEAYEIESIL